MALLVGARPASAYDAAVDATFAAQLYQVTSPFGDPVMQRQRYTETLTLRITDLEGMHVPGAPSLNAVARLRLDADFGQDPAERQPNVPTRFVPGLVEYPLDLMMAYVEGRNYARGLVGFKLGRQYVVDALGWWSFDGGLVRLTTPAHFYFEAYGGAEQRGGLPMLSTSRFEPDGVLRGNRNGMPADLWPAYLDESRLAPAYGFAVGSDALEWLDTRVTYRKVVNRDTVLVSPFPDANGDYVRTSGDRVSSEKVGWAGLATVGSVLAVRGDLVYDALVRRPSQYDASFDVSIGSVIDVGADAEYFLPTFDGDSIFNWFSHGPTTTYEGRVRVRPNRRLSFSATGGVRRFEAEDLGTLTDGVGALDASYRTPSDAATLRLMTEQGERGTRRGGDIALRHLFDAGLYDARSVVSLYDWNDPLRPDRATSSFTYVLGGGYRPFPRTRLGFEWEHSINDLVGQRFRALATLDLTVL